MKEDMNNIFKQIVEILKEYAIDAKKEFEKNKDTPFADYYEGILIGYYRSLNTIKGELNGFRIDLEKIGLDINIEKELLSHQKSRKIFKKSKNRL